MIKSLIDYCMSSLKYQGLTVKNLNILLSGFSSECVRQTYWISVRQVESVGWFEFNFVVIGWSSLRRHVSKLLRVLTHVAFYVTLQTGWMPAANHKRLSACQIETDKKREFSVLTKITENQIDGFLWGSNFWARIGGKLSIFLEKKFWRYS